MAEPVRNNEPLSDMRFPESSAGDPTSAPRPVSITRSEEPAGLLPESLPERPLGAWPAESGISNSSSTETRIVDAGGKVGSALGAVVNRTKDFGGNVQDRMSELKKKFRVISGRRSSDLKDRATDLKGRAAQLSDETQRRASELAQRAKQEARHWESRARGYAQDSPFRFVGIAAAAGFAIGFLLRLWRTNER